MPDQTGRPGLPFESGDARERELWEALATIEPAEPPAGLRPAFYRLLETLPDPGSGWRGALRRWLSVPWVPAAATLLIGIFVGVGLQAPAAEDVESLSQEVALLKREVALSRLRSQSAAERLRGAIDAADLAAVDPNLTRALLAQAGGDPSRSVRAAAIDALGARVRAPDVGAEVLRLLADGTSPLVQKALVDLILRHGDSVQLDVLLELAGGDALHPELVAYVDARVRRTRA